MAKNIVAPVCLICEDSVRPEFVGKIRYEETPHTLPTPLFTSSKNVYNQESFFRGGDRTVNKNIFSPIFFDFVAPICLICVDSVRPELFSRQNLPRGNSSPIHMPPRTSSKNVRLQPGNFSLIERTETITAGDDRKNAENHCFTLYVYQITAGFVDTTTNCNDQ